MQGLRTARARELLQACRLQGSQGPAHAPAAAAAPPVVSGADERRGEKYTRGSSAAAAAGWPASHCSAVAPRGRSKIAINLFHSFFYFILPSMVYQSMKSVFCYLRHLRARPDASSASSTG